MHVDQEVGKVQDHDAVTAVDLIADGKINVVVNTPQGRGGRTDGEQIRKAASLHRVSCVTTIAAALAAQGSPSDPATRSPVGRSRSITLDERRSVVVPWWCRLMMVGAV